MSKSSASKRAAKADEKATMVVRCKFDGTEEVFEIDLLDLTSEEEILVEEMFDKPLTQLWEEGWATRSAKGRVFFAYLARRRKQPQFTYDQAVGFNPEIVRREENEENERPTAAPKETGSQS